jgi:CheY-like chemotaxis protein
MTQTRSQSVPVLIVEDDPLVRMDTASFLEGEGFAVFEADDAATAIRSLELHEEIRLVLQT